MFAQRGKFRDLADSRGFLFEPFDEEHFAEFGDDYFADWIRNSGDLYYGDWLENLRMLTEEQSEKFASTLNVIIKTDLAIRDVLRRVGEVDAVITDLVFPSPAIVKSNLLHFPICSLNPLMLYPEGPPCFSGFSTKKPNQDLWSEYTRLFTRFMSKFQELLVEWYRSEGL